MRAWQVGWRGRLIAPANNPIGAGDDQGALGKAALVQHTEGGADGHHASDVPVVVGAEHDHHAVEPALAAASRILPIVTTAHLPSAANNNYWPEIYTNQSLVQPSKSEYGDTPSPKTFGNTSPLDPQLFSRMNDFADELWLSVLTRKPTDEERRELAEYLSKRPAERAAAIQELVTVWKQLWEWRRR